MVQYRHNEPYYKLQLSELDEDAVRVLAFEGKEQVSRLFHYQLELLSEDAELDPAAILNKKATLLFSRGDEDPIPVCGIISHFEQRGRTPDYVSYYAELVPRMWRLELNFQSRVFQNMNIEQMITEVLETADFAGEDFEFKLNETYPEIEFAVQYRETDFNFVNRRLEHFGIFYYFEHRDENDVIVFTDVNDNLPVIETEDDITYNPNKDPLSEKETISRFIYQGQVVTGKTQLKDYNYETPSKELLAESQINSDNPGIHSDYGDHFKDESEGEFQVRIRDEEIVSRGTIYKGNGDCRPFHAGYKFTMNEHYREDWNQEFLLTKVMSRGNQRSLFGTFPPGTKVPPTYENYFESMPEDIPFRPQCLSMQPKITGVLNAKVDSAGDGSQAEVDDQGRYKVILPFDLSGNSGGEASCFIRMIQPYAGPNFGMHFPLHKDTEVLLTFIDGNPDFPVISGAVANPETISPVTNANQTKSVIRDNYGNEIVLDATPDDEHIRLYSPHHNSKIEIGKSVKHWTYSDHSQFVRGNNLTAGYGNRISTHVGYALDWMGGASFKSFMGLEYAFNIAGNFSMGLGFKNDYVLGAMVEDSSKDILFTAKQDYIVGAGDEFCLVAGTQEPDNGNKNKSVVRATPDGITFALGEKLTETGEGIGLGDWYKKKGRFAAFEAASFVSALFALAGGVVSGLYEFGEVKDDPKNENQIYKSQMQFGHLGLILATIFAGVSYKRNLSDEKIEPVRHMGPPQKIWMHKSGSIGIISTKGDGDNPDGKKGTIVIGVNEQVNRKPKDKKWQYFDTYIDFGTKDASKLAKAAYGGFDSKAEAKEAISRVPEISHQKSLGIGSNIIIRKDDIELKVGEDGKENASVLMNEKGITVQSGKSKVLIEKNGDISLISEGNILIEAKKDIKYKSDNKRPYRIHGDDMILACIFKHPNLQIQK